MFQRTTLANGLRVLTAPMPHTRSVAISFYVGAGSRYETEEISGLSHFLEHMLFKGTERRPTSQEISEAVDAVGGVLNAGTDRELTVYYAKVAAPHFPIALDLLVDMLRRSRMDAGEIEKERKVVIEELATVQDSPAQQADVLLDAIMWPDQPLGWDVAGTEESVNGLSRSAIVEYFRRQYVPNNVIVSVAGAVEPEQVVEAVAAQADGWQPGEPNQWSAALNGQRAPRVKTHYKRTEQAHISLAVRGVSNQDPDRYAVDLLSAILGEGMSCRLFMELRERRSLCYDIHSYTSHYLDTGAFSVYAGVEPTAVEEALGAILEQLALTKQGIPEAELRKAKELTKGRLLLRMEDTRSVSGWVGVQELLTGEVRSVDDVVEQVEAVTTEDLWRVANALFRTEALNVALVGPYRSEKRFQPLLTL
ncbi:MAG: M16 family metallopeptidase [Dehalococcoidia bacterium]